MFVRHALFGDAAPAASLISSPLCELVHIRVAMRVLIQVVIFDCATIKSVDFRTGIDATILRGNRGGVFFLGA